MSFQVKQLKIGQIGIFEVKTPYLIVGSGPPRGVIMAGQHGGELSPLWVIKEFLQNQAGLVGTAIIVPIANPFGFIQASRNEPIEGKDLNRQFPGQANGDFTGRLAASLFSLCSQSDFVIDLHTFSRQTPFLAGYSFNEEKKGEAVKKILGLLKPEVIWKVNEKKGEDRRFVGSLDGALSKAGVPAVFIEMPNYQLIDEMMIKRIATSLNNVFSGFNKSGIAFLENIPEYQSIYFYADEAGLFEPEVGLLTEVKQGQVIGRIYVLPAFESKEVKAPRSGVMLTIKGKEVIRIGTKLGSLGI